MAQPRTRVAAAVLGGPDPRALAAFYQRLLGWNKVADEPARPGAPPEDGWVIRGGRDLGPRSRRDSCRPSASGPGSRNARPRGTPVLPVPRARLIRCPTAEQLLANRVCSGLNIGLNRRDSSGDSRRVGPGLRGSAARRMTRRGRQCGISRHGAAGCRVAPRRRSGVGACAEA